MGKQAVIKYFQLLALILTFVLSILTFLGLFAGNTPPTENVYKSFLCLGLPILLIANVFAVIYWMIRMKLWIIIPIITLACCWNYVGTIYQFRGEQKGEETDLKVATYNVHSFNKESTGYIGKDVLQKMVDNEIDVICMQEYYDQVSYSQESLMKIYSLEYPYFVTGKGDMMIFSKYPIKEHSTMAFDETNNSAMWADIEVKGKVIRVVNVHLQTTGINSTLHQIGKKMRAGETITKQDMAEQVAGSYADQFRTRGGQAIQVANEMRMCNKPVILCGDFNDTPYSFSYTTLMGGMNDGFIEKGSGWMFTYRGKKAPLRIDYLFHSPDMECTQYYVFKELDYSDHYPVVMGVKL